MLMLISCRYTLGFVFGYLIEKDLSEFVEDWNNHPIRRNYTPLTDVLLIFTTCPHCMVSACYIHDCCGMHPFSGKEDKSQTFDTTLWALGMASESRGPPPLCPVPFKRTASRILRNKMHLNLADITHNNCRSIYIRLVGHLRALVMDGSLRI